MTKCYPHHLVLSPLISLPPLARPSLNPSKNTLQPFHYPKTSAALFYHHSIISTPKSISNPSPNIKDLVISCTSLIHDLYYMNRMSQARQVLDQLLSSSSSTLNVNIFKVMIPDYYKANDSFSALNLPHSITITPDTFSYNTIFQSLFNSNNSLSNSFNMLDEMLQKGTELVFTYVTFSNIFHGTPLQWSLIESKIKLTFCHHHRSCVLQPYLQHVELIIGEIDSKCIDLKLHTIANNNGTNVGWKLSLFSHPVNFDTVFMNLDLKAKIKNDLDMFLKEKNYYSHIDKVWKRSHVLYNLLGIGESAFVLAMAKFLNYNIFNLDLSKSLSESFVGLSESYEKACVKLWSSGMSWTIFDPGGSTFSPLFFRSIEFAPDTDFLNITNHRKGYVIFATEYNASSIPLTSPLSSLSFCNINTKPNRQAPSITRQPLCGHSIRQQIANNFLTPSTIISLLISLNAYHVKIDNSYPLILKSFSDSYNEFVVGNPDSFIFVITNSKTSLSCLSSNILFFFPETKVIAITVGNAILSDDIVIYVSVFTTPDTVANILPSLHSYPFSTSTHFYIIETSCSINIDTSVSAAISSSLT